MTSNPLNLPELKSSADQGTTREVWNVAIVALQSQMATSDSRLVALCCESIPLYKVLCSHCDSWAVRINVIDDHSARILKYLVERNRKQMRDPTPGSELGRHVFGVAALASGLITLIWRDYNNFHSLRYIVYAAAAAQMFGGASILFRRTAKTGAAILLASFLVFVLLCVPPIVTAPLVYNSWGNFFEQLSILTGAAMVYARFSSAWSWETMHRTGRILLGICSVSFAFEQAFYLDATANLVPKWFLPSQMFWAVATTILFALAAVALLANRMALLAARLLTLMLVIFGLLVWVPLVYSAPFNHTNWSEAAETFAIAGAIWILVDLLRELAATSPL